VADQATQQTSINASADRCFEVAVDFERYPAWARDVKEAVVADRDADGRPLEVAYRAAALGRSIRYRLRYDYSEAPDRLSWELVDGDIVRRLDGVYEFAEKGAGAEVTYRLEVDLALPLPNLVKRRAEKLIMHTALGALKREVERRETEAAR